MPNFKPDPIIYSSHKDQFITPSLSKSIATILRYIKVNNSSSFNALINSDIEEMPYYPTGHDESGYDFHMGNEYGYYDDSDHPYYFDVNHPNEEMMDALTELRDQPIEPHSLKEQIVNHPWYKAFMLDLKLNTINRQNGQYLFNEQDINHFTELLSLVIEKEKQSFAGFCNTEIKKNVNDINRQDILENPVFYRHIVTHALYCHHALTRINATDQNKHDQTDDAIGQFAGEKKTASTIRFK